MKPKLAMLLLAMVISIPLDVATKAWIAGHLPVDGPLDPVIDGFFYLSHVRNPGAAFGLFADWPLEWRRIGFSAVALVASFVIAAFYRGLAPGDRWNGLALGLVLGGGLGNLWDRLVRGEVIDFLYFRVWGPRSLPEFNLADVFIIVGVAALMLELLVSEGAARATGEHADRLRSDDRM